MDEVSKVVAEMRAYVDGGDVAEIDRLALWAGRLTRAQQEAEPVSCWACGAPCERTERTMADGEVIEGRRYTAPQPHISTVPADEAEKIDEAAGFRQIEPMRLPTPMLEAVDGYATLHGIVRQAAIRELLKVALSSEAQPRIDLSKLQRFVAVPFRHGDGENWVDLAPNSYGKLVKYDDLLALIAEQEKGNE